MACFPIADAQLGAWKTCMANTQRINYAGVPLSPEEFEWECQLCKQMVADPLPPPPNLLPEPFVGAYNTAYGQVTPSLPGQPTVPTYGINWGDVGTQIVNTGVQIGLDYVKKKLTGTQAVPTGTNPVPGTPSLVPSDKCPEGQLGIPPACFDLVPGGGTQGGGMYIGYGEAVMGRYGAAIQPSVIPQQIRRCPKGAVLGNDGLCYNKSQLRRSDRAHIPGRKPLFTGGDLNAISRASRVSKKLQAKQKELQRMGMLPKPAPRGRRSSGGAQLRLPPGVPGVQLISND